MSRKMTDFDKVKDVMDLMMVMPIFGATEKRKILGENNKTIILNPNLIMDTRHEIFREPLSLSLTKKSVMDETKRLLSEDKVKELYYKKEQEFLDRELRRFEQDLHQSRPKFHGPYTCSRKTLADSNNDDFWKTSHNTFKVKNIREVEEKTLNMELILQPKGQKVSTITETEESNFPNIKVTIVDKSITDTDEHSLEELKIYFHALRQNAQEQKYLRNVKIKIQEMIGKKRLRKYFDIWKMCTDDSKIRSKGELKKDTGITDKRKIEMFVETIAERQKDLMKIRRPSRDTNPYNNLETGAKDNRSDVHKHVLVQSPTQNRLLAQKKIIDRQRTKLAEQNKIIEELKLQQIGQVIQNTNQDTVNLAKETLTNCGQRTRRNLIQLLKQEGYRDMALGFTTPPLPNPPQFLLKMEARAEARRERIKKAEEERRKKQEELKNKEEEVEREKEKEKKRLQREGQREIRKLRQEQEKRRADALEKSRVLNDKANEFYRKYLLRHYIMEPFFKIIEMKYDYIKIAENHYNKTLRIKTYTAWKLWTENQFQMKNESAESLYNRNLLWYTFRDWKDTLKVTHQKYQVAGDFYDMKLLEKYFKTWQTRSLEFKSIRLEDEEVALEHRKRKLKMKYFIKWKIYPTIAGEIKESEKIKDEWRDIIQGLVPDFDPKQRGVALDE